MNTNDTEDQEEGIRAAMTKIRRMVKTDAEIEAYLRDQRRKRRAEFDRYLATVGFPLKCIKTADFIGDGWIGAFERVRVSVMAGGSVWAICGQRGGGKTTLATALARDVAERGGRARFVYACDLFDAMRQSSVEALRKLGTPELLVVDEVFGTARPTEFQVDALAAVVRRRFDNELDTVMTSNGTPKATLQRLGATITSRMVTGGVITADWPSFRAQQRGIE